MSGDDESSSSKLYSHMCELPSHININEDGKEESYFTAISNSITPQNILTFTRLETFRYPHIIHKDYLDNGTFHIFGLCAIF